MKQITVGKTIRTIKVDKRTLKRKRSSRIFLAPSILGVALFFIIPFMVVVYYSMVDNPISQRFVFLDNFRYI